MQISFNWMTRIKSSLLWSDKRVTELQPSTIITTEVFESFSSKTLPIIILYDINKSQDANDKMFMP